MCKMFTWCGRKFVGSGREINQLIKGLIVAEAKTNPHGTGLLAVRGEEVYLRKRGINGVSFLIQEEGKINWLLKDADIVIGHVRLATTGEVSDKNSHPFIFQVGDKVFAGVHNGVFFYRDLVQKALEIGFEETKLPEVDSGLFFACVSKLLEEKGSLKEALKEVLGSVGGSYALIMYWDGKIYFLRDSASPLVFIDLRKKGLGIFLVSTMPMFERACFLAGVRRDLEAFHFQPKPYWLYELNQLGEVKKVEKLNIFQFQHWEGYYDLCSWKDYFNHYSWKDYYDREDYDDRED